MYDREMTDVFALQDEVAHAIANALRVKLSPETMAQRRSTRTFARMRCTSRPWISGPDLWS